ncbi:MAG: VWA domain-containing protein [bacterium]|nr:VWA domain-containing protein [bacterium]MDE0289358.1 VWA domain-containing protein [bacterium]MDE0439430.1 VWA domain-containing protein [bacterium]
MGSETGPTTELVRFGRLLRSHGVSVGAGQVLSYTRAVADLDPAGLEDLYWAGRVTLINRQSDLALYNAAFDAFFVGTESDSPPPMLPLAVADGDGGEPASVSFGTEQHETEILEIGDEELPAAGGPRASSAEILRTKHFDRWTEEEFRQLARLLPGLRLPRRRTRRTRPSPRGTRIDLRRSVRLSLRHGGELIHLRRRLRVERPRPIVLIVDVSGSMAGFSRALVQFSYGMSRASQRVEVFCFGTRLTRLTNAMRVKDPDAAIEEATELVVDWDGGTRIGESLGTYVTRWGKYRFNRGAMVIICSDGLERGEPDRLAWAMQRLSRQAHAVIWVNPLAGDPKFQPLARGLVAALPYVDRLIAGHSIEGLEDLAEALAGWAA